MEGTEDEQVPAEQAAEKPSDPQDKATASKDKANTTVGSVYVGAKIRHIKKEDGTPLWRKEIQYEFLHQVMDDETPVFTRYSDKKPGCNFADIYIDCLVHSSKTSKVLKERLLRDREAGKNMAMICLLVNVGRMNTTLNFFPEMRAQLRTYHSIPSLQAYKSQKDYKSLQDAPRLKSILKGASEDDNAQPKAFYALENTPPPARTNAVNCIFILNNWASRISEAHLLDNVDWYDLTMRPTISSKSRARAFLWLMYYYLESQWTNAAAAQNPFGPGQFHPDDDPNDPKSRQTYVPLEFITEEEGDKENEDPPSEIEFAELMTKQRKEILEKVANEPALTMADPGNPENKAVKRLRTKKSLPASVEEDSIIMSDVDSRASPGPGKSPAPVETAPAISSALGVQADSLDDDFEAHDPHPGRGRYKRVRGKNTPSRSKATTAVQASSRRRVNTPDVRSTPQPPPGGHVIMSQYGVPRAEPLGTQSKPRARTGYQRELEEHKQKRVEWALRKRRKDMLAQGAFNPSTRLILRTARRVQELEPTYDSEEEVENNPYSTALGGLTPRVFVSDPRDTKARSSDAEDWGGESERWLKSMRRLRRRMEVYDGDRDLQLRRALISTGGNVPSGAFHYPPNLTLAPTAYAKVGRAKPKSKQEVDAQIEEDLLAERSDNDEEMADTPIMMEEDGDGLDGDLEGADVESDMPMD